ncbi:MAG: response regulator [Lachnospiraceae bacterium]|nr:response regulator [Lachnospiraceae bacterium]
MQEIFFGIMNGLPDSPTKKAAIAFCNLTDPDTKFAESDVLSLEYLSYGNIWVRARYVVSRRDKEGHVTHVLWMLENINTEKRVRDSILSQAEQLNHQLSSVADIYMSVYDFDLVNDTFNDVKAANDQVVGLIGANRANAQQTLNDVMRHMVSEESLEDMMAFVDFTTLPERIAKTNTVTMEYLSADGSWRRARFIASQRSPSGLILHVLLLVVDIDQEKKAREALIDRSERAIAANEAKSSFLSNMSHEIRTPINAILGMNEMVLRESNDPAILTYSENLRTAGMTLLGLINDILDFSKIEAGKMEIINADYDIASLLNDLVNMIRPRATAKKLILTTDFDESLPHLLCGDEKRIRQIISNILTNAVKYTEHGEIAFRVSQKRIPGEKRSLLLCVEVRDTGIGIKAEDMEKLFSKFERIEEERNRSIEGTGLGMAITQNLLAMMGSRLEVDSIYGKGSIFSFSLRQEVRSDEVIGDRLNAADQVQTVTHREKYHESFRTPEAKILIVDDTEMNLVVFTSLLKNLQIRIDTALSGDEGIRLALENTYDIIFLDHMMPHKDGIETLRELIAAGNNPNRDTPVICLTANAISGARETYLAAGFRDYLSKPIEPEALETMLRKYLPADKVIGID